jgi:hypothetical protein
MSPAFAQQLSKIADVHGRGHKKISSSTQNPERAGEKGKRRIVHSNPPGCQVIVITAVIVGGHEAGGPR